MLLRAVGDIGPERADPDTLFDRVRDHLRGADITFGQLEVTLTERGTPVPQVRHTARSAPAAAHALRRAGFDVISWAGNHCLDWGSDGFLDTIDALESAGLTPLGVGVDIAAARRPRIVERDGVRVAFLALCSILPADYWATERRPGCAPMRAHTVYQPLEPDQPGTGCRILTFPDGADLAALLAGIREARAQADAVVVSLHWGIHFVPAVLADYQRAVAHAAIDAGADLILGHHAHILKPIEVHRGRAIFYSLGNFAMDLPMTSEHAQRPTFRMLQSLHPGWEVDLASSYNFPPDSRRTVVAEAEITAAGVGRVGLRPALIGVHNGTDSVPALLDAADPRHGEVVDYLREIGADQGIDTEFGTGSAADGDLVVLPATAS
ncbi:CapA family protein [Pseudonocardia lacus]|uniref:CapA family protein n=1 Tax=Pseudonocardia lacus TaxID=2835865 RepID=UPI001BDD2A3B|nr:CapA family protein [Pseudonocardia lacus]